MSDTLKDQSLNQATLSETSSAEDAEKQLSPTPMSAPLAAALQGIAAIISAYEETSGNHISANFHFTLVKGEAIPEGSVAEVNMSYVRNVSLYHPDDEDKPEDKRRLVEKAMIANIHDMTPNLALYPPRSEVDIMKAVQDNILQYAESSKGVFVVVSGNAVYLDELQKEVEAGSTITDFINKFGR